MIFTYVLGYIFDVTGSFDGFFYLSVVLYFMAGITYAMVKFINIRKPLWIFPKTKNQMDEPN